MMDTVPVMVDFRHKEAFRARFPRAQWDRDKKAWRVPAELAAQANAWNEYHAKGWRVLASQHRPLLPGNTISILGKPARVRDLGHAWHARASDAQKDPSVRVGDIVAYAYLEPLC